MEVTISCDTTRVTKKLSSMAAGFSNYSKPFELVGDDLLHLFGVEVFDTNGGAIGDNWRALAKSTLALRAARKGYYANTPVETNKTLVWTGRLRGGFKKEVKPMQLRIYNDVDYFKYHQKAGGKPPQRKMLGVTSRVVTIVIDRINQYAEQVIAQ